MSRYGDPLYFPLIPYAEYRERIAAHCGGALRYHLEWCIWHRCLAAQRLRTTLIFEVIDSFGRRPR